MDYDKVRRELKGRDPVFGYVRVSTPGQVDSGLGLLAQRAEIEAYADIKNLDADGGVVIIEDRGVSGSTPLASREGGAYLAGLLRQPWANRAQVILRVDRAWRSFYDAVACLQAWEAAGVTMHFVDVPVDFRDLMGKGMVFAKAFMAEMERAQVVTRTRVALSAARKNGNRYSGSAPWGFAFEEGSRALIPVEKELATCGRLLELGEILPRLTHRQIADRMNQEGRPLKLKPGALWSNDRVRTLLAKLKNSDERGRFADARRREIRRGR
jgi:DNA invertase Pin-like site-specific DNA recombinase